MTAIALVIASVGFVGSSASSVAPAISAAVWLLLVVAMALAFLRLVIGPRLPDRAVVLDLLASLSQGSLAVYAIATDQPALLDVAIAIALLSFLGTIAFARYIERRARAAAAEGSDGRG